MPTSTMVPGAAAGRHLGHRDGARPSVGDRRAAGDRPTARASPRTVDRVAMTGDAPAAQHEPDEPLARARPRRAASSAARPTKPPGLSSLTTRPSPASNGCVSGRARCRRAACRPRAAACRGRPGRQDASPAAAPAVEQRVPDARRRRPRRRTARSRPRPCSRSAPRSAATPADVARGDRVVAAARRGRRR